MLSVKTNLGFGFLFFTVASFHVSVHTPVCSFLLTTCLGMEIVSGGGGGGCGAPGTQLGRAGAPVWGGVKVGPVLLMPFLVH